MLSHTLGKTDLNLSKCSSVSEMIRKHSVETTVLSEYTRYRLG